MRVMIKTTRTATTSISLKPLGSPATVSLHLAGETPIAVPKLDVKFLATAAFDIT